MEQQLVQEPPPVRAAWNGKTNGFSVAALTMSLFGCAILLSIGFGIVGLVQSRRNGDRRGRFFAIASLVINGLVVGAAAVAIGWHLGDGPDRDASGAVRGERSIALTRVQPGDCIKEISAMVGAYVDVVPCTEPHNSEVFAVFSLPDGEWPGDEAVKQAGDAECASRYFEYAGAKPEERTTTLTLPPDSSDWSGKRTVTCMTFRLSPTTGTVRSTR